MRTLANLGLALGLSSAVVVVVEPLTASPQPTEPRPFTSKTDLVLMPVAVLDRHGVPVAGLTQDRFTVYDGGVPQTIEFFLNEDMPATVGLLIDSSGSMRARREEVTTAVSAFTALRHPLDEVFTANFNEAVWLGLPPQVKFAENAEQLRGALARAPAHGMTALYDAVDCALDYLRVGTRDRKALIVISDGGDNASSHTLDAVLEHARRSNAAIYSVSLFDPDDHTARPGILRKLARETGGEVFTPKRPQDMTNAFTRIAAELRSGYTIGFSPQERATEGFRPLSVVVDAGDRRPVTIRTRAGYYAGGTGGK